MAPIQLMYDQAWREMLDDFRACNKPEKWKYTFVQESGEYNKVWWDNGVFCIRHKNVVNLILSVAICAELVRQKKLQGDNDPSVYIRKDSEFFVRLVANHTGKHRGKQHRIKVPTAPGQPVRG